MCGFHIKSCILRVIKEPFGHIMYNTVLLMFQSRECVRRWLDKLGLGATLGLDVVMRQVLVGSGSYHLVDDNLDPLPVSFHQLLLHFKMFLDQQQFDTRCVFSP